MQYSNAERNKLLYSADTRTYYASAIQRLEKHLPAKQTHAVENKKFDDGMPLYIVPELDKALYFMILSGDNYSAALADMEGICNALTFSGDTAGPNANHVGVLASFINLRQDRRTRKRVPDKENEFAIAKGQYVFTDMLARIMKALGVEYLATIEAHSRIGNQAFIDKNIDVLNLTTARILADYLCASGLLKRNRETIVSTTDLGDLSRAHFLSQLLHVDLAVLDKRRTSIGDGTQSELAQELIHGDPFGKRVIVDDDMVGSGGTAIETIRTLLRYGAEEIIFFATHPVFSGSYYNNFEKLLEDPRVKIVAVADTLPLEERSSGSKSLAHIGEEGTTTWRIVDCIDIMPFTAQAALTLLQSDSLEEARATLQPNLLELVDPYALYHKITGKILQPPQDTQIYTRSGHFRPLYSPISEASD